MVRLLETDIIEASKKGMDAFLDLFVDAYWKELGGDLTAESMGRLNGHQNALLAYSIFRKVGTALPNLLSKVVRCGASQKKIPSG